MKCLVLFSTLLALTLGQTLVLIGGNLRDDNAPVWNKMVELAVSSFINIISYYDS